MDFQVKDMELWTQPLGTGQELLETSLRVKCQPGWGAGEPGRTVALSLCGDSYRKETRATVQRGQAETAGRAPGAPHLWGVLQELA